MAMDTGFKDENEERKKYKPGDKVRISKNPKDPHLFPNFIQDMDKFKGKIVILKLENDVECWRIEEGYYSWHERWFEDIESEELKETQMERYAKDLIIHCPTKELWARVVQKLLDEGCYVWGNDGKVTCEDYWALNEQKSCVFLLIKKGSRAITYVPRSYLQINYPHTPITPAEEFLGENTKAEENLKSETKDSTAQPDASRVKEKQGIIPEEEARQILLWYYDEFLNKEAGEYPVLDIRKAVLRKKLLDKKELAALLAPAETLSFRKAAKNLGVFLYQMITEKSEYTDISFHLDGYPPICKFSLKTSSSLNEVIENLANGRYRDTQKLKNDIQKLEEKTEEIEDSTNDEFSDSIPQYDYLGGHTYVPSDKNKQSSKSAPIPEWIVYQGAVVKNPDFISDQETVKEKSN